MDSKSTNALLRKTVIDMINSGWGKTQVSRALLGDNGQGHVNHWLNLNGDKINDFGVKPLSNIATQVKHEVHIVFLPKDGMDDVKQKLEEYNQNFVETLKNAIDKYLHIQTPKPIYISKNKSKIDKALDELLGITPSKEDELNIENDDDI